MEIMTWKNKLSVLDKRITDFAQGYRQNVALLGDDSQEISYLLEDYFKLNKKKEVVCLHASASYTGKKDFLKAIAFSLLSNYSCRVDTLDNLISYSSSTLNTTVNFIKECLKKENLSFLISWTS